jgi:hypothetical protein
MKFYTFIWKKNTHLLAKQKLKELKQENLYVIIYLYTSYMFYIIINFFIGKAVVTFLDEKDKLRALREW